MIQALGSELPPCSSLKSWSLIFLPLPLADSEENSQVCAPDACQTRGSCNTFTSVMAADVPSAVDFPPIVVGLKKTV